VMAVMCIHFYVFFGFKVIKTRVLNV